MKSVFTQCHGHKAPQLVSMTSGDVKRLCETIEKSFERLLTDQSWTLVEVPADGLCLVHSIKVGAGHVLKKALSTSELKDMIVSEIQLHPDAYSQFVVGPFETVLCELNNYMENGIYDCQSADIVVNCISDALGVELNIYEPRESVILKHSVSPRRSNVLGVINLLRKVWFDGQKSIEHYCPILPSTACDSGLDRLVHSFGTGSPSRESHIAGIKKSAMNLSSSVCSEQTGFTKFNVLLFNVLFYFEKNNVCSSRIHPNYL